MHRRRDVVRGSCLLTASALAGCLSGGGGSDSASPFVRWSPAPADVELATGRYAVAGIEASEIAAVDSPSTNRLTRSLDQLWPYGTAVSVREVDHVQVLGTAVALDGGIDGTAVREGLRGSRFESTDAIADYLTVRGPNGAIVASQNDRVVLGSPRGRLAALIDAHAGERERLAASSDEAGTLIEALPAASMRSARVHDPGAVGFPGSLAEGIAVAIGDGQTTATGVVVFESGAADPEGVAEWAATADPIDDGAVETTTRGNAVVVTATFPTSALEGMWQTFPEPADQARTPGLTPQVSFAFDYESTDGERGRLTITHTGGDAVDPDQLFVEGSGFADVSGVDQTAPGPWQGDTPADGRVTAGDSVVVGVSSDYEIEVVWEDSASGNTAPLATDRGPGA